MKLLSLTMNLTIRETGRPFPGENIRIIFGRLALPREREEYQKGMHSYDFQQR